jgi:hypothetical protein
MSRPNKYSCVQCGQRFLCADQHSTACEDTAFHQISDNEFDLLINVFGREARVERAEKAVVEAGVNLVASSAAFELARDNYRIASAELAAAKKALIP